MPSILIRNGTVIDPSQGINHITDILIEDGFVKAVAPSLPNTADKVLEARGLVVFPGLVDMHVHLRDPGQTEKEDIFTACNSAVAGGVTSVVCMPNTKPTIDNLDVINYVNNTALQAKARVHICASITKGLMGEVMCDFAEYEKVGVKAVSDDGRPVENTGTMEKAMQLAAKHNLLTISHCEDLEIVNGGIMHKGEVSEKLGVKGIDRASEDNSTAREVQIAKQFNVPIHIAHVSTKGAVEIIRQAKKEGVKVTCETCPHYFVYTHAKLTQRDADYRMNPPLREQEDVDAIIEGIKDGTIDCISTDHAPHTKKEKEDFETAPNGVIGLETSIAAGLKFLVEPGHISIYRLIELMSTNPAKILNILAGSLKVGCYGDLVLFDPTNIWTVLPERLKSKSVNSAFKFEQLVGRVKYTLVGGEIVYVFR